MKIKEVTYTETYKEFEVGEKVRATSNRCPLLMGRVYTVTEFSPPRYAGDTGVIFVEDRLTGLSTEYVEAVV